MYANAGIIGAQYLLGDGSNLTNIIADQIFVANGNVSSNLTFYPVFTSTTGNSEVELDNFGNTIDYVPFTGTLSFQRANVALVTNGGEETIDFDGINDQLRFSVTNSANAFIIQSANVTANRDATVISALPMQLAVYASNGARDSAIANAQPGMMIYVTGSGMQVRGATSWNLIAGSGT
jgi:hypothetical protein